MSKIDEVIAQREAIRAKFLEARNLIKTHALGLDAAQTAARIAGSKFVELNTELHKLLDADLAGCMPKRPEHCVVAPPIEVAEAQPVAEAQ